MRIYMAAIASILRGLEPDMDIQLVELPKLPDKGDVVDWMGRYAGRWDGYSKPGNADALRARLEREVRRLALAAKAVARNQSPVAIKGMAGPASTARAATDASVEPDERYARMVRASDVKPKPIEWLWQGRIALGKLTLIAGDPGLGKSLLTIAMAAHITRGNPWPVDGEPCPQGEVILLSAEDDPEDTIRPRLDVAGADPSKVHIMQTVKDGDIEHRALSLQSDIDLLDIELAKRPEVRALFIDPISAYCGASDSHKNTEVRGLLAPLADLAARHGVAIVAITHLNKGGAGSAIYRSMGSIAFIAAARAAFAVVKDQDDDGIRLMLPIKNNLGNDSDGVGYQVQEINGAPCIVWGSERVTKTADEVLAPPLDIDGEGGALSDAREFLLAELGDGPVRSKDLRSRARDAGHSWGTVRRAQKAIGVEVTKRGFVDGKWWWMLADDAPESSKVLKNPEGVQDKYLGHLRESCASSVEDESDSHLPDNVVRLPDGTLAEKF
jgi:putative DNA primase/helicase